MHVVGHGALGCFMNVFPDSSIVVNVVKLYVFNKSLIRVSFGNVFVLEQVLGNRDRFQEFCIDFLNELLPVFGFYLESETTLLQILVLICMHALR